MHSKSYHAAVSAAVGAVALSAGAAQAAGDPAVVQEVVVTAQLREQLSIAVPMALTAYTGKTLDARGVQDFEDLAPLVPGFLVQSVSPNIASFVIRGVSSASGEAFNEPRVSVFQDGVSISKSRGSYVELFDLERVEIAKGPQSTLYGRGALIGGVNLIQNKARLGVAEASARAEGGGYGYRMGEAVVNAPLGDTLALRLAARLKHRDGYVENLLGGKAFNGVDTQAYRAALNWSPGPALRVDLIGNYQRDRHSGTGFKSLIYNQTDPVSGRRLASTDPSDGLAATAPAGFEGRDRLGLAREVWSVTAIASWRIAPHLTLVSTSAYRRFDSLGVLDIDGMSLPLAIAAEGAHGRQTSQELRLNFQAGPHLDGVVGVAGFHENGSQRTPAQYDERVFLARLTNALNGGALIPGRAAGDPAPLSAFASTPFLAQLLQAAAARAGATLTAPLAQGIAANLKPAQLETATNLGRTDAADLFGDLTLHATDRIELGAGIRYTASRKTTGFSAQLLNGRSTMGGVLAALAQTDPTRQALLAGLAAPGAANIPTSAQYPVPMFGMTFQPTAGGAVVEDRLHDDGFSWRLTALYALTPDTNLYANYGRGRRPAVLAAAAPAAPGGPPRFSVAPAETVDSFEIGAKTVLADGRLRLDAAAFGYRYENFQTRVQQGTLFVTSNAGSARSHGLEAQATYVVSDHLELSGTYAFNHSRFRMGVRDGNHLRLSPDHSLFLGAVARAPLFGGQLEARPSFTWQSKVYFDDDNDRPELQQAPRLPIPDTVQDELQGAYGLAGVRLGYTPASGRWSVGAFVTNLFDRRYLRDGGSIGDGLGAPTFVAGEPRFWGVSLSIRR